MAKIKAALFDLDDTLISEHHYIESGYRHISKILSEKHNKDSGELYNTLTSLFNESPKNVFNRMLDSLEIEYTKDMIMELVEAYRSHLPKISFFDDVSPCLSFMKEQGLRTGIITDGFAVAQRQKLKAVNAEKYFDEIIVTDELGIDRKYWKPHPLAFKMMKQKFNIAFEEMVYIGDNPEKDFHISQELPIKTIRIFRNGVHTNKQYLAGVKEHHSIHNLGELAVILRH